MHILFTWEQGLGYGHLGHLYPIARLMQAAGHRVTLAVRHMENVWAVPDMPFNQVFPAPNVRSTKLRDNTRTFSDVVRPTGFADVQTLSACTRGWFTLFDQIKPDAVVCDHAFNAVFAARAKGLPVARLGTGFTVPNAAKPLPSMRLWQPHSSRECAAADHALLDVLNGSCAALGLPSLDHVSGLLGYGQEFVASWPELDHMGPQEGRYYYGPTEGFKGSAAPPWPAAGAGLPRVFMYLPGDHPLEASVLSALAKIGWPTLLHSRKQPVDLAPTQTFSAEPLDTDAVMGSADICISHSSHATSADAFRAGCVQMALPNSFERLILAHQMVRGGIAGVPSGDAAQPNHLADQLEDLIATPPSNFASVSARYAGYDPAMALQEMCEDMLGVFGGTL